MWLDYIDIVHIGAVDSGALALMQLHLSGIQPSGQLHLGNYVGCIKPFLAIQKTHPLRQKNIFLVADLHCFTKPERCASIRSDTLEAVRSLLALGIDPKHVDIVQQSSIMQHTQLAWYLSCLTKFSRAENMTQFKANREKYPNVGMFTYPILQAADILLYRPDRVLVGPDQRQHLELASELCDGLNRTSGRKIITKPVPLINNLRVMSLGDDGKMSKSDPGGCVFLLDSPELIFKKFRRAKTDSHPGISFDAVGRKSVSNLVQMFGCLSDQTTDEVVSALGHLGHEEFKQQLSLLVSEKFQDFRYNYAKISDEHCKQIIEGSLSGARSLAEWSLADLANKLGFI